MMRSQNNRTYVYFFLILGATLQGMGMSLFLFPHSIPSGGAAGIAILLNYWFHFPLGLALWLANIIFLVFALNYFGYTWTFRTILAVATTSTTVTMLSTSLFEFPHISIFFDLVAGGFLFGIGVGILIRGGASSGGMVIPALIIAKHYRWSPGKVMLGINFFIFLLMAFVIDFRIVLYAIICQFISTKIIDTIYSLSWSFPEGVGLSWRKK